MACGTPVLTTDKVNIWREVEGSGAGFVAADTLDGVTDLLRMWLEAPPGQRSDMRAGARAAFERHFRADAAARDLAAVLQLASNRRAA